MSEQGQNTAEVYVHIKSEPDCDIKALPSPPTLKELLRELEKDKYAIDPSTAKYAKKRLPAGGYAWMQITGEDIPLLAGDNEYHVQFQRSNSGQDTQAPGQIFKIVCQLVPLQREAAGGALQIARLQNKYTQEQVEQVILAEYQRVQAILAVAENARKLRMNDLFKDFFAAAQTLTKASFEKKHKIKFIQILQRRQTCTVWEATDLNNHKAVVVKVMNYGQSAKNVNEIIKRLGDNLPRSLLPHKVLDVEVEVEDEHKTRAKRTAIVTPHCTTTLSARLPHWPSGRINGLMHELAMAVQHMHSSGCLHCDIKIANIWFKNAELQVVLGDWGSAQVMVDGKATLWEHTEGYYYKEVQEVTPEYDWFCLCVVAVSLIEQSEALDEFIGDLPFLNKEKVVQRVKNFEGGKLGWLVDCLEKGYQQGVPPTATTTTTSPTSPPRTSSVVSVDSCPPPVSPGGSIGGSGC
eukprot:TRINITY_DN67886_c1_g5_i1.p1 TRINITY_DN67886_c1_g5~~TRINITY_DN67886_c1_g5_i1.p1  ORF type:complete len:464 (+),score=49.88 TRINITY_DN67886_c1_g5_i1:47-1438(+)